MMKAFLAALGLILFAALAVGAVGFGSEACAGGICEGRRCMVASTCAPCNTCMKSGVTGWGTCVDLDSR